MPTDYTAHESVSVDGVIEFLNELLQVGKQAVSQLIEYRVPCNEQVANHPSVQVIASDPTGKDAKVGFLGLLNGIFGADEEGWGQIAIKTDDDGNIIRFFRTSAIERKWGSCL